MIGTKLGKYEIREEIGKGGMAVVYLGFDTELERSVAVKVLHPHLSAQPESKRRTGGVPLTCQRYIRLCTNVTRFSRQQDAHACPRIDGPA